MATKTKRGIANATPVSTSLYDVTYVGSRDLDCKVPYDYLRRLAKSGWEVHVEANEGAAAHIVIEQ